MKMSVIHPSEIDGGLYRRWGELVDANPDLASPYFAPDFTQAVAAVRDDVFVGVLQDAGKAVGFFPFQRGRYGTGRPVGGPFSDCHGFIVDPAAEWSAEALIKGCGLSLWTFDHLLASQKPFERWHRISDCSPIMDLSGGYAGYAETRRAQGSKQLQKVGQKQRGLERDMGQLRFEVHTTDLGALSRLLAYKSHQYLTSGLVDAFQFPWTRGLLEHILAVQTPAFAGLLSVLYAGDQLAAVHMGMRSRTVWHYWFAGYAQGLARYSPSLILLTEMAKAAESIGITVIDMGKGPEEYKKLFATGAVPLAEGCVELPSFAGALRAVRRTTESWIRRSPLLPIARIPGRVLRRFESKHSFR